MLAQSHLCTDTILLRLHGRLYWKIALRPQGADPEYTLCRLLYTLLGEATGSTPPWGMMTGVRPVRIIHDMRASGATEDEIRARFLDHFACTPEKFALALGIADLQKPVLDAADPMDCSVYAGIPFCPTRCSYCSFVSRTVGDKADPRTRPALCGQALRGADRYPRDRGPLRAAYPHVLHRRRYADEFVRRAARAAYVPHCQNV